MNLNRIEPKPKFLITETHSHTHDLQRSRKNQSFSHTMVLQVPAGKPKSGRVWKTQQTSRASAKTRKGVLAHLSTSFEEKERIRAKKLYVKTIENDLKEQKLAKIEEEKQRRVDRDKRRAANEYRTSVFQTVYISICDYLRLTLLFAQIKPEKMKTMSKKQLRAIKKTAVNKHGQVLMEIVCTPIPTLALFLGGIGQSMEWKKIDSIYFKSYPCWIIKVVK
jgi:rRNA-processing protein CGR1